MIKKRRQRYDKKIYHTTEKKHLIFERRLKYDKQDLNKIQIEISENPHNVDPSLIYPDEKPKSRINYKEIHDDIYSHVKENIQTVQKFIDWPPKSIIMRDYKLKMLPFMVKYINLMKEALKKWKIDNVKPMADLKEEFHKAQVEDQQIPYNRKMKILTDSDRLKDKVECDGMIKALLNHVRPRFDYNPLEYNEFNRVIYPVVLIFNSDQSKVLLGYHKDTVVGDGYYFPLGPPRPLHYSKPLLSSLIK